MKQFSHGWWADWQEVKTSIMVLGDSCPLMFAWGTTASSWTGTHPLCWCVQRVWNISICCTGHMDNILGQLPHVANSNITVFGQVAWVTELVMSVVSYINKKHLKNVGPIHQVSLLSHAALSHAACASMSTTTTTTTTSTTLDRGDRYGPIEWAQ